MGAAVPARRTNGETVADAALRELFEETGLHVQALRLLGLFADPASQVIAYPESRVCHFITVPFACIVTGGDLRADGVAAALAAEFFSRNQLPTDLMRMHPRWLTDALEAAPAPTANRNWRAR